MRPIQEFVETELRTSIQQLTGDALPDASSGPSSPFSSSPPSSKSTQRSPTYSSRYVERDHHVPSTGAATKSAMEQGRAACAVASGSGARVGLIVDERGEGSVRQIRLPPQDQHASAALLHRRARSRRLRSRSACHRRSSRRQVRAGRVRHICMCY